MSFLTLSRPLVSLVVLCTIGLFNSDTPLVAQQGSAPLADNQDTPTSSGLAFMAGCWAEQGDGLREQFSAPTQNMILGTSRFVIADKVRQFEFHRIDIGDGTSSLTPYPGGTAGVSFGATELDDRHVVWENLEHDFPQRIIYDGRESDVLVAAIEGEQDGRTSRKEWRMLRVPCGTP
jgi:hypothetical protein